MRLKGPSHYGCSPADYRDGNHHITAFQHHNDPVRLATFKLPDLSGIENVDSIMQRNPNTILAVPLDTFAAFASAMYAYGDDPGLNPYDGSSPDTIATEPDVPYDPSQDAAFYQAADQSMHGATPPTPTGDGGPSAITSGVTSIIGDVLKAATPVAQSAVTAAIQRSTQPPPVNQRIPAGATIFGPGGTVLSSPAKAVPSSMMPLLLIAAVGIGLVVFSQSKK